jgi:DNA-binding transcriptional regulator LsrR (DeoR family)
VLGGVSRPQRLEVNWRQAHGAVGAQMSETTAMTLPDAPAHLVLMASVARRYYLDGKSKVEIAEELGVSRFKIARLLDSARTSGLVQIEITHPDGIDVELSGRLRDAYGLQHALVVDADEEEPVALRRRVGAAAAGLLREITTPADVLGLAWARSVSAMTTALTRLPMIPVVQLTGALQLSDAVSRPNAADSSIDIVRDTARISGGPAYLFYAPLILRDEETARALRRQPEVARAFDQMSSVTKAVVGIGLCEPGQSTVYDSVGAREQQELRRLGVRAEVSGVLVDADGSPVRAALSRRMIGVGAAQLRRIPEVVAIAYGTRKAPAVHAALSGGLVRGLVTHRALAELLVARIEGAPEDGEFGPT